VEMCACVTLASLENLAPFALAAQATVLVMENVPTGSAIVHQDTSELTVPFSLDVLIVARRMELAKMANASVTLGSLARIVD